MRQSHTIDALRTQNIDVIELGQLFWREPLRWAKDHVPGVVNHNIQTTVVGNDLLDCCIDRLFRHNIQFDRSQIDVVLR